MPGEVSGQSPIQQSTDYSRFGAVNRGQSKKLLGEMRKSDGTARSAKLSPSAPGQSRAESGMKVTRAVNESVSQTEHPSPKGRAHESEGTIGAKATITLKNDRPRVHRPSGEASKAAGRLTERHNLQGKIHQAEQKWDSAEKDYKTARRGLAKAENHVLDAKDELKSQEEIVDKMRDEHHAMKDGTAAKRDKGHDLGRAMRKQEKLEGKLEEARSERSQARKDLRSADKKFDKADRELKSAKQDLKDARARHKQEARSTPPPSSELEARGDLARGRRLKSREKRAKAREAKAETSEKPIGLREADAANGARARQVLADASRLTKTSGQKDVVKAMTGEKGTGVTGGDKAIPEGASPTLRRQIKEESLVNGEINTPTSDNEVPSFSDSLAATDPSRATEGAKETEGGVSIPRSENQGEQFQIYNQSLQSFNTTAFGSSNYFRNIDDQAIGDKQTLVKLFDDVSSYTGSDFAKEATDLLKEFSGIIDEYNNSLTDSEKAEIKGAYELDQYTGGHLVNATKFAAIDPETKQKIADLKQKLTEFQEKTSKFSAPENLAKTMSAGQSALTLQTMSIIVDSNVGKMVKELGQFSEPSAPEEPISEPSAPEEPISEPSAPAEPKKAPFSLFGGRRRAGSDATIARRPSLAETSKRGSFISRLRSGSKAELPSFTKQIKGQITDIMSSAKDGVKLTGRVKIGDSKETEEKSVGSYKDNKLYQKLKEEGGSEFLKKLETDAKAVKSKAKEDRTPEDDALLAEYGEYKAAGEELNDYISLNSQKLVEIQESIKEKVSQSDGKEKIKEVDKLIDLAYKSLIDGNYTVSNIVVQAIISMQFDKVEIDGETKQLGKHVNLDGNPKYKKLENYVLNSKSMQERVQSDQTSGRDSKMPFASVAKNWQQNVGAAIGNETPMDGFAYLGKGMMEYFEGIPPQ